MSTWASKLAQTIRRDLGIGMQIPPDAMPRTVPVNYDVFRFGLMLADRPADVPPGYYSSALDVESTRRDGVVRAPGVTLVEDTGHSLEWLAVHASLDSQSLLLAFAPPFLGVKEVGNFVWTDKGLDLHPGAWVASNFADTLLFSNGRVGYSRNFDTQAVALIPSMPGAGTLFSAFGRAFAGNVLKDGQYNALGIMWTGLTGTYDDWDGLGSGAELLINDVPRGDRIIAGRILSYNTVAILNRKSLWIGRQTNDANRPADFVFRIVGVGCVAEPTAKTTEGGVTFLSDEGVRHFDGNTAPVISTAINAELLPLDFANISKYKSEWVGERRRYILTTPTATYIYQFPTGDYPQGAWFKRGIIATNVISFAKQVVDPTWDDFLLRTWDDLWETWAELGTPELDVPPDLLFMDGNRYGFQDEAAAANFGVALNARYQPRPKEQPWVDQPDRVFVNQSFLVDYAGSGTIDILADNELGVEEVVATAVLAASVKIRSVRIDALVSERAGGITVRITAGTPEIMRIRQLLLDNGPVLDDTL